MKRAWRPAVRQECWRAQYLSISIEQRQQVLEEADVVRRMQMILAMMTADRQAA
jgi:hypothetical protein